MRNLLVLLLSLVLVSGCSSRSKPLLNIANIPVYNAKSVLQVEKAIVTAGVSKGWRMTVIQPGRIQGDLSLRVHTARILIDYNMTSYSITYQDSQELGYDARKNTIHRNYNNWIIGLQRQIDAELTRIQ